jgi:predicted nucleic acid-binding Zn ribbon protein
VTLKIHQPDPGPEKVGDILGRLFTQRGWGRRSARQQLEQAWKNAVDPVHEPHTRVLALRRGTLEIEVNDAVILQELSSFHRRKLLEKVKKALPNSSIRELRFRSATW